MRMRRSVPALPVVDVSEAVAFYEDEFGFAARHEDEGFAVLTRDEVDLHLWAASDTGWKGRRVLPFVNPVHSGAESFLAGTASCRIEVDDVDALYDEYRERGVLYDPDTVIEATPWGTREFPALDLHRNLLVFFERRG